MSEGKEKQNKKTKKQEGDKKVGPDFFCSAQVMVKSQVQKKAECFYAKEVLDSQTEVNLIRGKEVC